MHGQLPVEVPSKVLCRVGRICVRGMALSSCPFSETPRNQDSLKQRQESALVGESTLGGHLEKTALHHACVDRHVSLDRVALGVLLTPLSH